MSSYTRLLFLIVSAVLITGCSPSFEKEYPDVMSEYKNKPQNKALSFAKDSPNDFVYGYGSNYKTVEEAKENALYQCRGRRKVYKIKSPCEILFINDQKVEP